MLSIRNWYRDNKGSVNGLPVVHCSVNLLPNDEYQGMADDFINEFRLVLCVNDYNADPRRGPVQTNAVHDLFQDPYLKPLFLVINCVSNSPSYPPWTLLADVCCISSDVLPNVITQWRILIDSVQAPPPELTDVRWNGGIFEFTFPGQRGRVNSVECSTNFVNWTVLTNATGTTGPIIFHDPNALSNERRFYRVRRL